MNIIYIAGAHSRATTMGHYLTYLNSDISIEAYLYDNDETNPSDINGIPVIKIDETTSLNPDYTVYLGTRGVNHEHLINTLTKCGMKTIIPVDVKLDSQIRNDYLKKYYASRGKVFSKINEQNNNENSSLIDNSTAQIFVANSIHDKSLETPYQFSQYETILQVGASLISKKLETNYFDNTGDNISDKNSQFCELTGLYWIWKNATKDIVGLCHYRRHFILPDDWKERMIGSNIDVILPVPLYVYPSLAKNYKNRHDKTDWDNMMMVLKQKYPAMYESAIEFFSDGIYSPCNMVIARKPVFDAMCEFVFDIVFECNKLGGTKPDSYQNRYPGFLSERLMSFFFNYYADKYKCVYADKNFLQ